MTLYVHQNQWDKFKAAGLDMKEFSLVVPIPVCPRCHGRGWLCEAHPELPFEHDNDCPGPGDPCPDCNELARHD